MVLEVTGAHVQTPPSPTPKIKRRWGHWILVPGGMEEGVNLGLHWTRMVGEVRYGGDANHDISTPSNHTFIPGPRFAHS